MKGLYWAASMAVAALVAYLASPTTNWIPRVSKVLTDELPYNFVYNPSTGVDSLWEGDSNLPSIAQKCSEILILNTKLSAVEAGIVSRHLCTVSFSGPTTQERTQSKATMEAREAKVNFYCRELLACNLIGKKSDAANAFWYLQDAVAYYGLHDLENAKKSLEVAATCKEYSNFCWKEVALRSDWRQSQIGKKLYLLNLMEASSVLLPDFAQQKAAIFAVLAAEPKETLPSIRALTSKIGTLLCQKSETIIGKLVGRSICTRSLRKDVSLSTSRDQKENFEIKALTAQIDPQDAIAIIRADKIAKENFFFPQDDLNFEAQEVIDLGTKYRFGSFGIGVWLIGCFGALMALFLPKLQILNQPKNHLPLLLAIPVFFRPDVLSGRGYGLAATGLCLILVLSIFGCSYSKYLTWAFGILFSILFAYFSLLNNAESVIGISMVGGSIFLGYLPQLFRFKEGAIAVYKIICCLVFVAYIMVNLYPILMKSPADYVGLWAATIFAVTASVIGNFPITVQSRKTSAICLLVLGTVGLCSDAFIALKLERQAKNSFNLMKAETRPYDDAIEKVLRS